MIPFKRLRVLYRDIIQFGLTPHNIAQRIGLETGAPKVLANSIPKAGTNLLLRSLYLLPEHYRVIAKTITNERFEGAGKRLLSNASAGAVVAAHLYYSEDAERTLEETGFRHVMMVRDPRDIAVSQFKYIAEMDVGHPLHRYYSSISSEREGLQLVIHGLADRLPNYEGARPFVWRLRQYFSWADHPCHVVRFEDLVGPAGGGSESTQIEALREMTEWIGVQVGENELQKVASRLFSSTARTFRKGKAGEWRKHLNGEMEDVIVTGLEPWMQRFGYLL